MWTTSKCQALSVRAFADHVCHSGSLNTAHNGCPLWMLARRWSGCAAGGTAGRRRLVAVDVPAKLSARVRLLWHGHNRKTDQADAVSVAVAWLTAQNLRTAEVDQHSAALRVLTEHREDLVRARTRAVNRERCQLVVRLLVYPYWSLGSGARERPG